MNTQVRTYLIEVARTKGKFVTYADVVRDCNLGFNLATEYGRLQLSNTLGEVSAYENEHQRPLISSLAIYSDTNKNDHGDGFYRLAESLGIGKFKKLKDDLYAFEEAEECRKFWQDEDKYSKYAHVDVEADILSPTDDTEEFFTSEELEFFKEWQYKAYDPEDETHVDAKNQLMDTVWEKSIYLGKKIIAQLPGFALDGKKYWSQRGWKEVDGENVQAAIFKPYTWVKVFRDSDKGRDIYFTFGVDAHENSEAFIYKIDCRNSRDSSLSESQIELCKSLIPANAKWNEIGFEELLQMDWQSLTAVCVQFINEYLTQYDAIIEAVWGSPISPSIFKNTLIKRDKPQDGATEFQERERSFTGVDIDHAAKTKEQKDLGDKGEQLVKQYEISILRDKGRHEDAAKVDIVKDGMGYDVLSFDEFGKPKYIEVKTTTGNQYAAFHLSDNEFEFMKRNIGTYSIYRVYNYDEENNFGEFFEITDKVQDQLLMKPTNYTVILKANNVVLS